MLTLAGGMDRSVMPTRLVDTDAAVPNRYELNTAAIPLTHYRDALLKAATHAFDHAADAPIAPP